VRAAEGISEDRRHRGVEQVAAPRDRPDHRLRVIVERAAYLEQALRQGIVGHRGVGPDGGDELVLRNEPPVVQDQIFENVECLRPEGDFLTVPAERTALQIQDAVAEPIVAAARLPGRVSGRHNASPAHRSVSRASSSSMDCCRG